MQTGLITTLRSSSITLRPITEDDFHELYRAASDPEIWEFHPNSDRYQLEPFKKFFRGALDSKGGLVIIDNESNTIIGSSRYYDEDAKNSSITIGYTFIEKKFWGKGQNKEIKRLMIEHAQKFYENILFNVDSRNIISIKSLEKIGATKDLEFQRQDKDGVMRTAYIYKISKRDI